MTFMPPAVRALLPMMDRITDLSAQDFALAGHEFAGDHLGHLLERNLVPTVKTHGLIPHSTPFLGGKTAIISRRSLTMRTTAGPLLTRAAML